MKTIYSFLFLLASVCSICLAQDLPPACKEGAENKNCSAKSRTTSSTLSVWDWTNPNNYTYYISNVDPAKVQGMNPFTPYNSGISANDNVTFLYYGMPNITTLDYQQTDGWELILKEFGTPKENVDFPYFVLYNRYESKMRIFILIPRNSQNFDGYNAATIRTQFSQTAIVSSGKYQSGLLEHISVPANALTDMKKEVVASTPNSFYLASFVWLIADIPVAYDPCTCYFPSMLDVQATGYKSEDVNLNLHANGVIDLMQQVSDANGVNANGDGINTLSNVKDGVEKGTKVFKSLAEFGLAIGEIAAAFAPVVAAPELAAVELPLWFTQATAVAGGIGAAGELDVSILDLFIGGGKAASETKPTFFHGEETFDGTVSGTIDEHQMLSSKTFYTPGCNVKPYYPKSHPVYDNTLGVMTLLKTPELITTVEYEEDPFHGQTDRLLSLSTGKLKEDIVYAINPSSGLSQEAVDIHAAIIIEDPDLDIPWTPSGVPRSTFGLTKVSDGVYRTPYLPLPCLKDYMFGASIAIFAPSQFISPHPNINIYPTTSGLKSVKLQLVATLKRDPLDYNYNPNADDVLFAASYRVNILTPDVANPNQFSHVPYGFSAMVSSPISNVKENPVIENLSLSADQTIYGYGKITIKDNIQTNGHHLTLIAGKEIVTESTNTDLLNDMDLKIGMVPGCEGKIPAWSTDSICIFCNKSETYDPTQLKSEGEENASSQGNALELEKNGFLLNAYPSPFSDITNVQYMLWENENVTLSLSDYMGKQVQDLVNNVSQEAGAHKLTINGENLSSGIYFLTLRTSHGVKTVKVIKE